MTVADSRRMSEADRAGLAARSPEGHAAKSMHIREGSKRGGGWGKGGGKNGMGIAGGENSLWPERMGEYQKHGNLGGKIMAEKNGRV
jgi:hypothetical protein